MAKFNLYQNLLVPLPEREYPIVIGHHILTDDQVLGSYISSKQVLIVTNTTIAPLYLNYVQAAFADRQCDRIILNDGEAYKNRQSLWDIYDILIEKKHHRDTTLIALGGGVVGDITGFAAATYQRGVPFLQIPTTLLAQVDAAVGGKTAINHPQAKNMIGCFHQPTAVIIDLNTLQTLPLREFRAGLAEIIKYALLAGGELFELVANALQNGLATNNSPLLPLIISRCCQFKADIIQVDEKEQGIMRVLLNLGHTFAHALEAYSHYTRWLHGEAVAIGLSCAALLSFQMALLDKNALDSINKMLKLAELPRRIPKDIDLEKLVAIMSQDKKNKNNNLRFILMKAIGNCYIDDKVTNNSLYSMLHSAVEGD